MKQENMKKKRYLSHRTYQTKKNKKDKQGCYILVNRIKDQESIINVKAFKNWGKIHVSILSVFEHS